MTDEISAAEAVWTFSACEFNEWMSKYNVAHDQMLAGKLSLKSVRMFLMQWNPDALERFGKLQLDEVIGAMQKCRIERNIKVVEAKAWLDERGWSYTIDYGNKKGS